VEKKLLEIRQQTAFERVEFIFIEPASPGLEREVLEPFCERYTNCRCITLDERVSLYRAWNLGWEAATAPLVCISNMDDAMHPELLERVLLDAQCRDWDVATVLIAKQSVDAEWNSWDYTRLRRLPLSTRPGAFFVWRNELKETLGMFNEALSLVGDKEFWARVGYLKLKIGLIPEVLYLYTKHPTQLSRRPEFHARKKAEEAQCKSASYQYIWPRFFRRRIRVIRWSSRLFLRSIYLPVSEK
jgi:hypothetical protein